MAVTPNYSWPIPVATDLVKDGYQAIADLGDAIDATVFALAAPKSTNKTDTFTTTAVATWTDITGLSVTITPSTNTKKILLMANVSIGVNNDVFPLLRFVRNSTAVGIADTAGSRTLATSGRYFNIGGTGTLTNGTIPMLFIDSPATTSSITYKIQVYQNAAGTIAINRNHNDADNVGTYRAISNITVIEV